MDESSLLSSLHKENIVPNLSLVSKALKSSLPSSVKPKRGQWYSPCSSPRPKQPHSPDDYLPILKLTHFEKTPRVLFNSVKLGSSKIEELVVWNPNPVSQTLRVEKCPSKLGFFVECSGYRDDETGKSVLTLEPDEELVLPIKWEPKEAGKYREIIVFKWNETHRLQTILIGTAVDLKTKKKRPSVLGLSQAFNTKAPKKTFKPPQFSVLTKDAKPTKEKPECNFEFGKRLPEVKEEVSKENAEERRETYVVKCGSPANLNKKPENLQTEKQHINVNKANTKKEIEENNLHTYKLVDKKIDSNYEQKPVSKPRISIPAWKGVDELKKIKTKSDIIKEEKVVPNATAFSVEPINKKVKSTKSTLKSQQKKTGAQKPQESPSLKKTRKVKLKVTSHGVAPTKLKLARPPKTSIPRHPMPFAAKNMYYDERWIEKQEEGFTRWMNFVLTPPDDCDITSKTNGRRDQSIMSLIGTKSMQSSQPKAPSKEELSLKAYTARRKMSRLRRLACLLYQSEPVICVLRKLEAEVEEGRIAIRPDKKMHADLGIKNNIIGMLLSYNPLWLRIGLETIFGEIIPIKTNSDVHSLSRYVSDRLLGNPDIARTYAHPKVPGLYREGYVQQLSKFTLKKFLFLVLFLDRAKLTRLIDHDPCLFVKDADFKSSRSLLLTFSSEYLKCEGDITKHLSYLGFSVSHEQRPIDEFNYAVTNIATDLRDGLRLTRIVELLTHNWKLTQSLRVPAISRLQKIHNVEVFMKALKEHKIPLEGSGIDPRHVVDGHREKTLQLLWLIIFNFQVNILLNEKQLNEEISFLEQNQDLVNRLETMTVDVTKLLGLPRSKRESLENNVYFKSPRLGLLLKWCRLICKLYGMKIENFTVSFSDGRALCYLLHYYHPYLLPLDMIKQDTTLTRNPGVHDDSDSEEEEGIITDSWAGNYSPGSGRNLEIERLKANERENFKLLAQKVQALGGVPLMAKFADMSNTIPDEKVVITYTSYLCARLLDLREETRAARTIQVAWKKYLLRKYLEKRRILNDAAVVVQSYARGAMVRRRFIKLKNAAILIQSAYRGYCARLEIYLQRKAAMLIQAKFRATRSMCCEREEFLRCKKAIISMQALVRGKICRNKMKKIRAAVKIQAMWRCHEKRVSYLETRKAALVCQKLTKGSGQRKKYLRLRAASVTIQSHFRAVKARNEEQAKYDRTRKAIVTIQACYRGHQARVRVKNIRAAVTIQKYFKMRKYRSFFLKQREAVIKIQAQVRRFFAQKKYVGLKNAVCVIQRRFKAYSIGQEQRENYKKMRSCCVKIQALQRGYFARKRFLILKNSTIKIQAALRRMIAQTYYRKLQNSVLIIQKHYRSYLLMKQVRFKYISNKYAAITIQAFYRRHQCRRSFLATKLAALQVQAFIRGYQERKKFRKLKNSVVVLQRRYLAMRMGREERLVYHIKRGAMITIQAAVRGFFVRQCIKRQHFAATAIQATFRCFAARKKYTCLKSSVIIIQQRYRAYLIGKAERDRYLSSKDAALTIQAFFRGMKTREEIRRRKSAAIIIQAMYRCYMQKRRFNKTKEACLVLQARYRAERDGKVERNRYQKIRKAVLALQAYFRGWVVRKELREKHKAATVIQARFRCYVEMSRYSTLKQATEVIQWRYRALKEGRAQRQRFKIVRASAVCIQSAYRGYTVRRMVCVQHHAAVAIQATYRCYAQRSSYLSLRSAALSIQGWYRAIQLRRIEQERYKTTKNAVLTLQAAFKGYQTRRVYKKLKAVVYLQSIVRGCLVRRQVKKMNQAAVCIQTMYRGFSARKDYLTMKQAVSTIQAYYKAFKLGELEASNYQGTRNAAIKIQSFFRGYQARKQFKYIKAALRIQTVYRGHVARKEYISTRKAIICIQATARCFLAARYYRKLRRAAICMQQRHRANLLLLRDYIWYHIQRGACIVIQSAVRRHVARTKFLLIKDAVLFIQRRYRAVTVGRQQKHYYEELKMATLTIQCFTRGMFARKYARECTAARKIQAFYRMYSSKKSYLEFRNSVIKSQALVRMVQERRRYLALKQAVLTIQLRCRAILLGKAVKRNYNRLKSSTVVIQKYYRGFKARNEVNRIRAAVRIQATYKAYVCRKEFLKIRRSVVIIQSSVRRLLEVKQFQGARQAAITLQTRFRAQKLMKKERSKYLSTRNSTILTQAMVRGLRARSRYVALRKAAICIQTKYRASVASKIIRGEYLCLRNSVIVIQCAFRSMKARELATKMQAARTIQSLYRMYVVRKNFLLTREAVVRIQAYEKMRKASREYSMLKSAVLTCQRLVRANQQCKEQRAYYTCLRKNVILMQSIRRGNMARCRVKQMVVEREKANEAAAKIQNYFRGYLQMRYLYLRFRYIRRAIITIQSVYRGHVAREYTRRVKAASIIQACYRGSVARRSYHLARQSIIYLQAVVRCHQVRVNYLRMKRAAVVCQQRYKATRRMKEELRHYQHTKEAITRIQAVWRGHMARGTFCNTLESIVMVQSLAKMYIARKRFNQMRNSVMVLQCRYRALCLGRAVRRDYSFLKNATITIQSFYRGYQTRRYVRQVRSAQIIQRRFRAVRQGLAVRREYAIIKKSVLVIQAAYRGYKGRKEARLNEAAIIIQANVRGYIVREQIKRLKEAQFKRLVRFASAVHYNLSAVRIQRAFKQAQALKLAKKQINSVLFIQCWWRATLLRRRFLAMRKAAILIQRATRRNRILKDRAATRIQSIARVWLAWRTVAKMITAAVRVQALWRGYQVRRRVTSLKIKAARRRIRVANNAATESMKLCNRTRSALDYLLRCKNLTTIFDVLVNLEVVTRLSYVCCEQLVKDQALRVIFTVIRNSNRSVPHIEILKYALAILINLAKCPTTYRAVYEEQDSLMTLLELISIFREKEQIFSKTCCLLTILGRRDNGILEEMLNTPKMTDKIKSAHYLITRKTKLVKRRSVIKAKMAQSTPYKSAPPATPCRQTPFKSHTPFKARRISEWAMWQEYVNKVQDPLQSVRSLMRTLHIEYEEPNVN